MFRYWCANNMQGSFTVLLAASVCTTLVALLVVFGSRHCNDSYLSTVSTVAYSPSVAYPDSLTVDRPQQLNYTANKLKRNVGMTLLSTSQRGELKMPCPQIFHPVEKILTADWMEPLLEFLSALPSKQVVLVTANAKYKEVLLNWIISATVVANPPMENLLVLALDQELHDLLQERQIASIYVPTSSLLDNFLRYATEKFNQVFRHVVMVRLAFLRLLNWFGFDAASFDTDAIILKNPLPLFENHTTDIVASIGLPWPPVLFKKWNFTLCSGTIFFRSNKRIEEYWNVISNHEFSDEQKFKYSDQSRVNFGVDKLGLTWRDDAIHELDSGNSTVGICKNNLTVTILPANVMCRNCEQSKKDQYYTWHYYSLKTQGAKRKAATKGEAWFLHPEWLNIDLNERSLKGREWLKAISDI